MVALVFAMFIILVSCGNQTIDSDKTGDTSNNIPPKNSNIDENSNSTVNSDNSTNLQNPPEENPVEQPNDNKDNLVEEKLPIVSYSHIQNDEYYSSAKFIRNVYYSNLSYEFGEWYKIVKSYEELTQIDSEITVDQAIFQENYILVVHRYYNGGLYYDYIGYKNARETEEGFEITLDCYEPEEAWTEECRYVESVEYLVVPKTELENVSVLEGKLILNYGERNFYTRTWHYISEEKASELENGNVWSFKNPTECVEFMEAYGVSHPIFGSALKDYTRVVIYFEKGTNIGIGYSNCNVTENEFYITNETLESDNVVLLEPALCVIIIPKSISVDEISDYNVIVQENVVERMYMTQGRIVATCCEQPNLVSYEIDNGDGTTATLTYCTNEGCTYTLVDNIEYNAMLVEKEKFGTVIYTSTHKHNHQGTTVVLEDIIDVIVKLDNPEQWCEVRRAGGDIEYNESGYTEYYLYEVFVVNKDGSLEGIFEIDMSAEYNNEKGAVTLHSQKTTN